MSAPSSNVTTQSIRTISTINLLKNSGWSVVEKTALSNNRTRVTLIEPDDDRDTLTQVACSFIYLVAAPVTFAFSTAAALPCLPCATHAYCLEECESYDECCGKPPYQHSIVTYHQTATGTIREYHSSGLTKDDWDQVNQRRQDERRLRRERGDTTPCDSSEGKWVQNAMGVNSALYDWFKPCNLFGPMTKTFFIPSDSGCARSLTVDSARSSLLT